MAYGLAVEGTRGPYVGEALVAVATCGPDEAAAVVAARCDADCLAVVVGDGVAVGLATAESLRAAAGGATIADVMEIVPDTLRPSELLEDVDGKLTGRLVTTPDGVLLGAVDPDAVPHHHS